MKLNVTGRNVTVSPTTRQTLNRKLGRIDRVLQERAISAQVVLGRERAAHICELTVHARGDPLLHAVGRHARLPGALANAVEKVTLQAQKLSDRWKTRRKIGA